MQTFCWCCYLKGQGHSEGSYDQIMTLSTILSELYSLAAKLGDTSSEARVSLEKNGLLHSGSRSQQRVKMLMFVQMISSKPPNIVSKLGIVMHHYESECHAKRLLCYLQGQGHCKSSYDQNMTISTVSFELLILLQPNLV